MAGQMRVMGMQPSIGRTQPASIQYGRLGASRQCGAPAAACRSMARRQTGRLGSAATRAAAAADRLESQVAVVLGSQWGDEGKGKLVDILAQQYDVVARAQVRALPRDSSASSVWHRRRCRRRRTPPEGHARGPGSEQLQR